MPSLQPYSRDLDYSYALGLFPAMEALTKRPQSVRRMLLHSSTASSASLDELLRLCAIHNIRVEQAGRILSRLSGKDNVFAAAVVGKEELPLLAAGNHLVLHHPSDKGNLGTILRSALGFGFLDIAIIRPAADHWDPQVLRASMGASFSLRISAYDRFEEYRTAYPEQTLYPLMLEGSTSLQSVVQTHARPYALITGNEGSGLPDEFAGMGCPVRIPHSQSIDSLNLAVAASIAMYAFSQNND